MTRSIVRRSLLVAACSSLFALSAVAQDSGNRPGAPKPEPGPGLQVAKQGTVYRIMTYNVENWRMAFMPRKVLAATQPGLSDDLVETLKYADRKKDEECWEVARTVMDVQPDIWVFQEGCDASDLNYFNTQFLGGYFETVHIFKTNTDRGQNTGILLRPGFKVLEFKEDYHDEPDTNDVNPTDKLFARGPGFALVQGPHGEKFWVGTNHEKSKSGNSVEVSKWRNAEAKRVNEIVNDLKKNSGTPAIFFLGDMNDELGVQEFEQEAGGSSIEMIAGQGDNALEVLTKKLADKGMPSFGGYRSKRHRSFIDHAFATPEAAKLVRDVNVFTKDLADVASDHYPVYIDVRNAAKGG